MKFLQMKKTNSGKYLNNYELIYENRSGKEKHYEMISRRELQSPDDIGNVSSGISMIVFVGEKMLLLREFRMAINRCVYNLCAGMINKGETIEECCKRELFEETGLTVTEIITILPPSYAAVAISDVMTNIVIVRASGEISTIAQSENEEIEPKLFSKEELKELLSTEEFSSRSQLAAWIYCNDGFPV